MDENNIHNDTDEHNRDIIKTMLSLMLFLSFCPTFMGVCKYLLNDCINWTGFAIKASELYSVETDEDKTEYSSAFKERISFCD